MMCVCVHIYLGTQMILLREVRGSLPELGTSKQIVWLGGSLTSLSFCF